MATWEGERARAHVVRDYAVEAQSSSCSLYVFRHQAVHACLTLLCVCACVRVQLCYFWGGVEKKRKRAHFVKAEIETTCTKDKQDGEYIPVRHMAAEIISDTARVWRASVL